MLMPVKANLTIKAAHTIKHLTDDEVNALTKAWMDWYDYKGKKVRRKARGQYFLTFLVLRFTGARHGEVYLIDDNHDIDYRNNTVILKTLKQKKPITRAVPIPAEVVSEIARYLMEYPDMKGKLFKLDKTNFRKQFYEISAQAGIPKDRAYPHILRHTRAIELLRAGVPITMVQELLGHAYINTTAMYLRFSNAEIRQILKEKGLI